MQRDSFTLPLALGNELIVDNFAGGGGASTGIEAAIGRPVDIAINHNPEALAMHRANHPSTAHYCESVWDVDPREVTKGQPVGLVWLSPDCFPSDTMVLTDRGYRAIQTIREGDMVLTHAGRYRRVYATMSTRKPVHEVDIQGVPTIRVSSEHPFYARPMSNVWDNENRRYKKTLGDPEWVTVTNLRVGRADMNTSGGDRHFCGTPCVFPVLPIPEVKGRGLDIDERLMWLAGRYVGDGWSRLTDDRAELVIICGKSEADEVFQKLNVWPHEGDRSKFGEIAWHRRDIETACQFSTSHRGLVEWLRSEFGHGGAKKSFPAWALGCAENLRRALLDGYVSADGSSQSIKAVKVVETVTISRALAFSTKSLAESLGYTAQVFEPRKNSSVIEGREVSSSPVYRVRWRPSPLRRQTIRDGLHNWSRVQRVSDANGEMDVFNISVEDDETYIADGIVVHNCKHFSKAKGGKPVDKKIRGLAWVALRWAAVARPRVIMLENVEEFVTWGPVVVDGEGKSRPCPKRKGREFNAFVNALRRQGYQVEWRELRAADYGAPTIRKRFFLIARRDGLPIVWPRQTHADLRKHPNSGLLPWRTAAECIDWSIPCPSIFERKKPLADATLRRVAKGTVRYVLNAAQPFIVKPNHTSSKGNYDCFRGQGIDEPMQTITQAPGFALATPFVAKYYGEKNPGEFRGHTTEEPFHTQSTENRFALVSGFLAKHYGGVVGYGLEGEPLHTVTSTDHHSLVVAHMTKFRSGSIGFDFAEPMHTVTAGGESKRPAGAPHAMGVVTSNLVKMRGDNVGQATDEPLRTISAGGTHFAEVRHLLAQYHGNEGGATPTGLVAINGEQYAIVDIGLRMLEPHELFRAQGFPEDYIIDRGVDEYGNTVKLSKSAQVRMCGNSVCPDVARALVEANFVHEKRIVNAA